jgi:hypothetical protein
MEGYPMYHSRRLTVILVLVALMLALPTTALASKKLFQARLNTGSELHQVVGSRASGSASFGFGVDGTMQFQIFVANLTGQPTGVHIHGPADVSQNAPIILTLCGNPGPAVLATCSFSNGTMSISGAITPNNLSQWGITAQTLVGWMEDGLTYVNVHTALNPAGEVRGQIYLR